MSLSRRRFLGALGMGAFVSVMPGCGSDGGGNKGGGDEGEPLSEIPVDNATFAHGVASGDPFAESVVLWTRVTQDDDDDAELTWVVARDVELRDVVAMGEATAKQDRDFTVKVVAEGLEPGTTYYYAFFLSDSARSPIGRTRTLPEEVDRVRLAFTSCANYGNGHFHAYRAIAQRHDLDVWIHLGDYIYEYGEDYYHDPSVGRPLDPKHECVTLEDYRKRYAHYRSDLDLKECHRQHPLIVVWDDHEVANNAWKDGAENHQPDEGDYAARQQAGTRAFLEWLPIRVEPGKGTPAIYRQFAFGKLFDLIMLDTRHLARDEQAGSDEISLDPVRIDVGDPEVWNDPKRTLLGKEQMAWFEKALTDSKKRGATWRLIGNQIIFSRCRNVLQNGAILFSDFWDGYKADQQRVLDLIRDEKVDNIVFLTGDIHTSWVFDVAEDPFTAANYDPETGEGALAVEFVGPSVTSQAFEDLDPENVALFGRLLSDPNPNLKFLDLTQKGYVLVDVAEDEVQGEWYFMDDIKTKTFGERMAIAFKVASKKPHVVETKTAKKPKEGAPAPAPEA